MLAKIRASAQYQLERMLNRGNKNIHAAVLTDEDSNESSEAPGGLWPLSDPRGPPYMGESLWLNEK